MRSLFLFWIIFSSFGHANPSPCGSFNGTWQGSAWLEEVELRKWTCVPLEITAECKSTSSGGWYVSLGIKDAMRFPSPLNFSRVNYYLRDQDPKTGGYPIGWGASIIGDLRGSVIRISQKDAYMFGLDPKPTDLENTWHSGFYIAPDGRMKVDMMSSFYYRFSAQPPIVNRVHSPWGLRKMSEKGSPQATEVFCHPRQG